RAALSSLSSPRSPSPPIPWTPVHPTYLSGTSTHALHRGHLAVSRPVGPSTFRMAFRITTSAGLRTRRVARQVGQRPRSWLISMVGKIPIVDRYCQEYPGRGLKRVVTREKQEGHMSLRLGDTAP